MVFYFTIFYSNTLKAIERKCIGIFLLHFLFENIGKIICCVRIFILQNTYAAFYENFELLKEMRRNHKNEDALDLIGSITLFLNNIMTKQ